MRGSPRDPRVPSSQSYLHIAWRAVNWAQSFKETSWNLPPVHLGTRSMPEAVREQDVGLTWF